MSPHFTGIGKNSTMSSADLSGSQSSHGGGRETSIHSSGLHQGGGGGCIERRLRNWKMSTIGDDDGVGEWKEVMINSGDEQCRVQILAIFG